KRLLTKSQELHRYIHCNLNHPITCSKCESIFSFFEKLKVAISEEYFEILDEYQQKLIAWMAHHITK
ncbi:3202_t:CDS:2, partial [Rhizophagus irregularis]